MFSPSWYSVVTHRIGCVALITLCATPCLAQKNQQQPALSVTPQFVPSADTPPISTLNDKPPGTLPDVPRLDSFPPQIAAWVRMRGAGLARVGEMPNADDMPAYVRKAGGRLFKNLGSSSDDDIMTIAFLVIMEAAKAAREDLKSIMERTKEINEAKARLRRQRDALRAATDEAEAKGVAPCAIADCNAAARELTQAAGLRGENPGYRLSVTASRADVEAMLEYLKKEEDKISEMGEAESLQLRIAMDRRSKVDEILGNLLKKASDTKDGIAGNIK